MATSSTERSNENYVIEIEMNIYKRSKLPLKYIFLSDISILMEVLMKVEPQVTLCLLFQ